MIEAAFFAVAVLAALYLLAPVFQRGDVPASDPRIPLLAARDAALRALKDLDLDWATGKLSNEDYQAQRAAMAAEAADVVRRLRALAPTAGDVEDPEPPPGAGEDEPPDAGEGRV